jgi:hypothetical protein
MLRRAGQQVSYSNVIATLALFVALGGSAYAISKNSVKSKHIEKGQVKSSDLKDDGAKSKDVKDENLTGDDIADGSLGSAEVTDESLTGDDVGDDALGSDEIDESALYPAGGGTGENPFAVPISGILTAQARNIGAAGTTYATIGDRAPAEATMAEAATGNPANTLEFGELRVKLAAPLAAGQSRTFTVVRDFDLVGPEFITTVACTIDGDDAIKDECTSAGRTQSANAFIALRIESAGAGLTATDDAYFGMATRMAIVP